MPVLPPSEPSPPAAPKGDERDASPWREQPSVAVVASFRLQKSSSPLNANIAKLQYGIFEEIGVPYSSVAVISLEPLAGSTNWMNMVFGIWPYPKSSIISSTWLSLIREIFLTFITQQSTLHLTTSLFVNSSFFNVRKFPGGVTIIPQQSAFLLQKVLVLFNLTLNFPICKVQDKLVELKAQMKSGLLLNPYENLYVSLTNSKGSTIDRPTVVQTSIVLAVGNRPPSMPRLRQWTCSLCGTLNGLTSRNVELCLVSRSYSEMCSLFVDIKMPVEGSEAIERAFGMVNGVKRAIDRLSLKRDKIHYDSNITSSGHLIEAVEDGGFGAELISSGDGGNKVRLKLTGITSSKDASLIQSSLEAIEGASHVEMDVSGSKVNVSYDPDFTGPRTLIQCIQEAGQSPGIYHVSLYTPPRRREMERQEETRVYRNQLLWSCLSSMPVFMLLMVVPMIPPYGEWLDNKASKQLAIADRTLARVRNFGESDQSCFNEPFLREGLFSEHSVGNFGTTSVWGWMLKYHMHFIQRGS